ncbi:a-factor receptor [Serendipita sp. 401]|nr:a-factor receptor [Serendipita sp. 397]KAG8796922.1 a-factor receptor [Serendipita sp. 398]KAG8827401.1 a-factor receptor [Serendipita sp. 401]KAG8864963.1 a-factor receptor [Serendipita sp. 405]KAG9057901.1 a-factor receptor [Serendipita sp. 407]
MDLLIGLGIPALVMILHYIVQGHRYDILEDYGCWPTIYMTPLAIPLVLLWPLLISAVSIPYCVLSYRSFYRHRANFQKYLAPGTSSPSSTSPTFSPSSPRSPGSPNSSRSPRSPSSPIPAARQFLTPDRYLRLMALSSMELLLVLPLNLLSFISNLTSSSSSSPALRPYTSWRDVHSNFGRIVYVTRFMMNNSGDKIKVHFVKFEVARWAIPITGWLFFVFFGVSVEAKRDYQRWWNAVRNLAIVKRSSSRSGGGGGSGGKRSGGGSDDGGHNRVYGSQSTLLGRMFKQRRPSITTTEGMGTMKSIATTNGDRDMDERKSGDRLTALPTSLRTDHKSRMERRRQRLVLADSLADEEEEEVQSPTDLVHVPPLQIPDSIYHPHLHTSPPPSSGWESPMGTVGNKSWDSNKPLPPTPLPSRPPSLAISLHTGVGVGVRHLAPPPPPPIPPIPSMPSMTLPLLSVIDEFGTVQRTTDRDRDLDLEMGIESEWDGYGGGETTEGGETETVYHTPALSNYRLSLASSLVYPHHQQQQQHQQQPSVQDVSVPVSVPGGWPSLTVPSSSTATGRKKDGKGKGKGKGRVSPDPSWGYY